MKRTEKINLQSFGKTLRAFRLGYRISEKHNAFIRLSPNNDKQTVNVTIVPLGVLADSKAKTHVCWWDKPEILDLIPAIKNVKNPKKIISFDIDAQTGERIM